VTGWVSVHGVLSTVYRIEKLKKSPRPVIMAVEPILLLLLLLLLLILLLLLPL
jgi:hypothetical protein